jgi:hypothetical protein
VGRLFQQRRPPMRMAFSWPSLIGAVLRTAGIPMVQADSQGRAFWLGVVVCGGCSHKNDPCGSHFAFHSAVTAGLFQQSERPRSGGPRQNERATREGGLCAMTANESTTTPGPNPQATHKGWRLRGWYGRPVNRARAPDHRITRGDPGVRGIHLCMPVRDGGSPDSGCSLGALRHQTQSL